MYSGDPSTSTRDQVRFLIGDVSDDPATEVLSDDEVDWLLAQWSDDPYATSVEACRALEARFAGKADKSVGDLSIQWSQIAGSYRELRKSLAALSARQAVVPIPYAGGISIADKDANETDDDLPPRYFRFGQMSDSESDPDTRLSLP